ncbi:2'-5' RNA ligase family protein [Micromonospora sp. 4G57]|uniref:2'-5' RNA ligase family protein n=1 Tax=Micromonospora sicca TaxID=2202420 RepID=A0ABU5JKE9_9ACTN|nr:MULTISPECIES: 2'-5' RNA ligase family protein [unclassified Micromonospora]MDZ5447072.1 2'-5' RNA ligase family protein [Micromonospora sp. 4G57]MDZ5493051.1 2'-5' RNA ligase family protein [Micromonospora sp. 4G53]
MTSRERDSLQQRWDAYQRLPELVEHWYWRPGWRPDRSFYTWHVTFEGQTALHDLVTSLQKELALPGLDPVPLDGLHLTMQGLGFTDEVHQQDLVRIIDEARNRCAALASIELTLGPVDPDAEGIGLLVAPWNAVEELRLTIRDAVGSVWTTVPEAADGFRPHVTIAYSGDSVPTQPIRARLVEVRDLTPVTVRITEVPLIALRREDRVYRWDTVATVRLGQP